MTERKSLIDSIPYIHRHALVIAIMLGGGLASFLGGVALTISLIAGGNIIGGIVALSLTVAAIAYIITWASLRFDW